MDEHLYKIGRFMDEFGPREDDIREYPPAFHARFMEFWNFVGPGCPGQQDWTIIDVIRFETYESLRKSKGWDFLPPKEELEPWELDWDSYGIGYSVLMHRLLNNLPDWAVDILIQIVSKALTRVDRWRHRCGCGYDLFSSYIGKTPEGTRRFEYYDFIRQYCSQHSK